MEHETTDIFIAGAGPAGLAAACAFGAAGFSVVLADPQEPVTGAQAAGADLRSTAILRPGRQLLEAAGVWQHLAPHAKPLAAMRIVDISGQPLNRAFEARDLGHDAFGWNLSNTDLRASFMARLAELPHVRPLFGARFQRMLARDAEILVTLCGDRHLRARLAIACDGRGSPMRQAAGIEMHRSTRGQRAVVFTATHPEPHRDVSTEVHDKGGPFTLVPLPDQDGVPCSAIVWMTEGAQANRLLALPQEQFEAEATARSAALFGPLTLRGERQVWPIISQYADRLSAPRLALAAEAAHVVPPIGAQGLNMSLADIAALLELAQQDPQGLGGPAMLERYQRKRWLDIRMRIEGVNLLNMASQAEFAALRPLRAFGIRALHDVPPLRHMAMRLGLGG